MMCGRDYGRFRRFFFYILVALPALLSVCGKTPLWSQNNDPLSKNSDEHLTTWEALSGRFTLDLEQHEKTLKELGQKLQTSEASLRRLTPLCELLSQQNESLKTYNAQIAERMQERDEDLAASYAENERKDKAILKLVIAVILLCIPYIIKTALWIAGKFKS
jgi:cytochrome c-type biogenesis protein CcmH/NrfG